MTHRGDLTLTGLVVICGSKDLEFDKCIFLTVEFAVCRKNSKKIKDVSKLYFTINAILPS